jgi:23S rRNA-/tRNA-specific pseudouridylate synthase
VGSPKIKQPDKKIVMTNNVRYFNMDKKDIYKKFIIPATYFGSRLDHVLSELLPELSRSKIQNMIKQNLVMINGNHAAQKQKVVGDEEIIIKDIINELRNQKIYL